MAGSPGGCHCAGRAQAARSHHAEGRLEDAALELDRSGPPAAQPRLGERARLRLRLGPLEVTWAGAAALPADDAAGPAALQRALELDPGDAHTHLNAGTLLEKMGRVPEAVGAPAGR
ncbi:MAG: hypothetical protein HZB56_23315 [Deltaproteobacteria bacterium]|nr:hypothetical protein [Deltaproteobacteria bacterium]